MQAHPTRCKAHPKLNLSGIENSAGDARGGVRRSPRDPASPSLQNNTLMSGPPSLKHPSARVTGSTTWDKHISQRVPIPRAITVSNAPEEGRPPRQSRPLRSRPPFSAVAPNREAQDNYVSCPFIAVSLMSTSCCVVVAGGHVLRCPIRDGMGKC